MPTNNRIKVGDIMTRNFISVKPETNLIECAREMIKKRVGSLIIKKDKKLDGLITQRDIIWALIKKSKKDLSKIKAKDITPKKIITVKPSLDLNKAFRRMKKTKYRWLPVVYKKNVIGMLTLKDILRVEPSLFNSARAIMQIEASTGFNRTSLRRSTRFFREGMCEECGNFDFLYKIDNRIICESCKEAM